MADRAVIARVEHVWLRNPELANPESCLQNVGVVSLSAENFRLTCGMPSYLSSSCVRERGVGTFLPGKILYLSYSPGADHDKALVQATLHALAACTYTSDGDKYDKAQFRDHIWYRNSGKDSVEYQVLEELGL